MSTFCVCRITSEVLFKIVFKQVSDSVEFDNCHVYICV